MTEEKNELKNIFSSDESKKPMAGKKTGKIVSIYLPKNRIIAIDSKGNGIRIEYDEKIHKNKKVGDEIDLP